MLSVQTSAAMGGIYENIAVLKSSGRLLQSKRGMATMAHLFLLGWGLGGLRGARDEEMTGTKLHGPCYVEQNAEVAENSGASGKAPRREC